MPNTPQAGVFINISAILFIANDLPQKRRINWGQIPIQDNFPIGGQPNTPKLDSDLDLWCRLELDSMRNAIYASHEKCIHSANIVNDDTHPQRALRITDCMAGNNYIFTGTKPTSICYAENQMHIVVKYILPSCYESPSLISKLTKLTKLLWIS